MGPLGDFAYEEAAKETITGYPGIIIGKGVQDQSFLRVDGYSKELDIPIKEDFGFYIQDGEYELIKLIDYYAKDDENE